MSDLRVALIGYGLAGRFFHAPLIAATPGLELAVVVTADPARASQLRSEHPRAVLRAKPEELWGERPDLVVVATPNHAHAALARAAIAHRVAVVVDKPLAVSADEAMALLSDAEAANVMLTVFQNRRWDSDQLTLRRLIAEDALGEVVRYESRFERWRPQVSPGAWRERAAPQEGGGQLLDLGSHLVDQALVLFGPVTHVYGEIAARRGLPGDDDAFLALRHAGGVLSHLHASAVSPAPGPRLRVQGSRAAFVVTGLDPQEAALRSGARPDQAPGWGQGEDWARGRLVAGEHSVPIPSEPGAWPRFYELVEEALRSGTGPPVDPVDAVRTLRIIEAARRSSAERSVVSLVDPPD